MCEGLLTTLQKICREYSPAKGLAGLLFLLPLLLFSACKPVDNRTVDELNSRSYYYHYKSLDSTAFFARKALAASDGYHAGKAEAYNNLAFVDIMKMKYQDAYRLLDSVRNVTDNMVELFVADVQQMRLCQRESHNKDFYDYYERAKRTLRRINEERELLSPRLKQRVEYAESELHIIASTYYYYVGLDQQSTDELYLIDENTLEEDTAQYLNYIYQIGAGGILSGGSASEVKQQEWTYLMRCYRRSMGSGDLYWQANALQGLSEHLFVKEDRDSIITNNRPSMLMLNPDQLPDSLVAGYLAERALELFKRYGDVYQVAGCYRTLASCYWNIGDYYSALENLENSLEENRDIRQAPNLVASIYERLSLVYSAIDDKSHSDYFRNSYLDLQDSTRQDRLLEARAAQLSRSSSQLNWMIVSVLVMIFLTVLLLYLFNYMRKRNEQRNHQKRDVQIWRDNDRIFNSLSERSEEIEENLQVAELHLHQNRKRNLDNRAKIFLVNSIMPLIDRMIHEIKKLQTEDEDESVKKERLAYIAEITDTINDYNQMLTEWIQLRQGDLKLRIESFPVQEIFDMVKRSRMSFHLKGIELQVHDCDAVVKADKILTLFMVNTIADNARKFTHEGGKIEIMAQQENDYVEFSVTDTGEGMTEEQLGKLFTHQIQGGHGFGLLNCRGIIEHYKKISKLFSVCTLQAESKLGEGSRLFFRLPLGIKKLVLLLLMSTAACGHLSASNVLDEAVRYTDSAYYSNVNGTYERTLQFADSARHYMQLCAHPDTSVLLGIANETAVAALALHQWDVYRLNNRKYIQLYKEITADHSLGDYVSSMQRSSQNKTVAVYLLVLLLAAIIISYYMVYYRPQVRRQHIAEQRSVARSREAVEKRRREVELQEDELRKAELENQQLYISNNVIDNCLSTLKHETMYYPSRIRHLLPDDGQLSDIQPIAELASYYKELYSLLSQQVMDQVENPVANSDVEDYLFEIFRRESGGGDLDVTTEKDGEYTIYKVNMPGLGYRDFFKPVRENIPYLICRQIVREISEVTKRRGCGIVAEPKDSGTVFNIKVKKINH